MEVLYFVIGVVVGCVATCLISRLRSPGTIVVDHSDPDSPYPFLEGKIPLNMLERRKFAMFQIEKRDYLPPK